MRRLLYARTYSLTHLTHWPTYCGLQEHSLMRARALRAIEWVMARPDGKLVALVAHGHFLLALTGARVRIVKTAWWYDGMVA